MITLEMTPRERYLVYMALNHAYGKLKDEHGYRELLRKVAALPCGEPGCSICDPNYLESNYD